MKLQTMDSARKALAAQAGCSALSWESEDGKHLWGRNMDFNRLAEGTQITFVPRGTQYYTCGCEMEHSARPETKHDARYAAIGTGLLFPPAVPVLYEGVNEQGLMGGQLYFRGFAHYETEPRPGTLPLQPPFLVSHCLAQCASVDEVVKLVQEESTLVSVPLLGAVPPLHWSFSDRTGETIVIESDADGLHLYRHTIGVMTNSPGYSWHRTNLLAYAGLRDLDYDAVEYAGDRQEQCFSGSGAQGLPGDWSSPSRFVRLAFLRKHAVKAKNEEKAVTRMLHLFESAAFPLGAVRVSEPGEPTALDADILPFDYTIYTAIYCAESLRVYWTTYENQRVQCADLHHLMHRTEPVQFDFARRPDFLLRTQAEL